MVGRTIDVKDMLKDSQVVRIIGRRQEVLLLEMVDWSKATKLGL